MIERRKESWAHMHTVCLFSYSLKHKNNLYWNNPLLYCYSSLPLGICKFLN